MKCRDARELLNSYIDNGLDPEKDTLLMGHVAKCRRCSEELRFLVEYRKTVQGIKPVKAPQNFMQELHKRLVTEERGKFRRLMNEAVTAWRRFTFPLEAAGVIAVALLIFFLYTPLFHGVKRITTLQEEQAVTEAENDRAAVKKELIPPSAENKRKETLSPSSGKKLSGSAKSERSFREEEKAATVTGNTITDMSRGAAEKSLYDSERSAAKESMSGTMKKDEAPGGINRRSVVSESKGGITADVTPEGIISRNGGVIIDRVKLNDGSIRYTVDIEEVKLPALAEKLKEGYSATYTVTGRSGRSVTVEFVISE